MRRDYTNQYGYFCPTENEAIYSVDREIRPKRHNGVLREEDIEKLDENRQKRKSITEYFDSLPEQKAVDDPNIKTARQVKAIISKVLSLAGFSLKDMVIVHRESEKEYKREELEG